LSAVVMFPFWLAAEAPLLYVPFDGSDQGILTTNRTAKVTPFTSMKGPFVQGVKGQARVLGGKNKCSFFLNNGFHPPRGTLMLWVRPEDWAPASSRHFVFFTRIRFTEIKRDYVRLILYKYWNANDLVLLVQNTVKGKQNSMIRVPIESWQKGEWHHLAVTWNAENYRLFVDGKPGGKAPAITLPSQGRWEIAVGTPAPGWLYLGKERNAIDEVAIWPRAMSGDEVKEAYEAGAKSISTQEPDKRAQSAFPKPIEGNIALDSNGAFALASSFKNFESLYSDNLVDGTDASAWQPFDDSLPQWVEVRWEVPLRINEVVLRQQKAGSVSAYSVFGWADDKWKLLQAVDEAPDQRDLTSSFEETSTGRVRVVIREADPAELALTSLAVRGPNQPILEQLRNRQRSKEIEEASLTRVTIHPSKPRPGQTVTVEVGMQAPRKLKDDYAFLLETGDKSEFPMWENFSIAKVLMEPQTPTTQWTPGQEGLLKFNFRLPEHSPDGMTFVRLHAFGRKQGSTLEILNAEGEKTDEVAKIHIRRFDPEAAPALHSATARFEQGSAALDMGGQKTPPAAWSFTDPSFDRFHYYSQTGIHLYHVKAHPLTYDETPEMLERTCGHLDKRIRAVLRTDPGAVLLVDFDLRPGGDWLKRNPKERLVTAFGKLGPVCFSSAKYNDEIHQFVRQVIAHLHKQPYYDRIAGYLPMACGAPDSSMGGVEDNLFQKDRAKMTFGDYNPQAIAEFRVWLKTKYKGSAAALRDAWQDEDLTFDTARPKIAELVAEGADGGVFRDPLGSAMTFDYAEWLSGVMGRFYSRLMKTIRSEAGRPIVVGTYYGYNVAALRGYNNPGGWFQNNNFDLHERLQNPDWDFFAAPTPYSNRRAGTSYYTSFTHDSVRLHGKLLMGEHDHRTFVAGPTTYGRLRSDTETEAVLKRDVAGTIIDGAGYWFADWSRHSGRDAVGFFMDPGILDTIGKTMRIHQDALKRPRSSVSEIAVITSGKTARYHDLYRAAPIYHNLIPHTLWDAMGKMGAPYDIYTLEDISHQAVRENYKLYIFLNTFYLTPFDRQAIEGLKRDGKTLLFFYAPGYVSRQTGLKVSNIERVTGIRVTKKSERELMEYKVTDTKHPVTDRLADGAGCRIQPFSYALSRELHPPAFGPVFHVEDPEAVVLGKYPDGKAALAVRDMGDWKTVYCAVPRMNSDLLRGVARYAGVHLYSNRDVVMKVDNRLLMLHNGYEGDVQLDIALPGAGRVVDAYSGEVMTQNGQSFVAKLPKVATRLYWLNPPPETRTE